MAKKTFEELFSSVSKAIEQDQTSFKVLYDLIAQLNPIRILEIGFGHGGSARMFQNLVPEESGRVFSVELQPVEQEKRVDIAVLPEHQIFVGRSEDPNIVEAVRSTGPYDVLFIDGDHSYDGVKADYQNYSSMVRPGGLIAFHDHGHGPILQFWNEIEVPDKKVIQGSLTIGYFYKG